MRKENMELRRHGNRCNNKRPKAFFHIDTRKDMEDEVRDEVNHDIVDFQS